jgi:4-alpha-glucanotransferase
MGGDSTEPSPAENGGVVVVTAGKSRRIGLTGELVLEDGSVLRVNRRIPADVPLGYHELRTSGGDPVRVIVAPSRCPLPPARMWGWAVQLYGARSSASWGFGDLADLWWLGNWAKRKSAGFLLINPLAAPTPLPPLEPSPYFPSSRLFKNPLYLRIEAIPGAETLAGLDELAAQGRGLNSDSRIDRDQVWRLKREALERLWARMNVSSQFEAFRAAQGPALETFATFCVLAEQHGRNWREWPVAYRHPRSPSVSAIAADNARRVAFHAWIQWLLDEQMARATTALPIVQDLPIGIDPAGADAWAWQDVVASGAVVGAPPDRYNPTGQSWGLAPFIPHRLAAAGYEPFVQTLRASLRHARGLRIDHVMGLFRLYWIPGSSPASEGAFVRYPATDLLAILALESQRAGAFVVGEDLGTVERGVREHLAKKSVLSYRVLWFEEGPVANLPKHALASVTTHDLPTIQGLWTGEDVRTLRALGLRPNEEALRSIRDRIQLTALRDELLPQQVIEAVHRLLGSAPSLLLTATMEDAFAMSNRPNVPGAPSTWPNWSVSLPLPIESLETNGIADAIAKALVRSPSRRGGTTSRPG